MSMRHLVLHLYEQGKDIMLSKYAKYKMFTDVRVALSNLSNSVLFFETTSTSASIEISKEISVVFG